MWFHIKLWLFRELKENIQTTGTYSRHVFHQLYDDLCYLRRSGAFHPPVALPSADVADHDTKRAIKIKGNNKLYLCIFVLF